MPGAVSNVPDRDVAPGAANALQISSGFYGKDGAAVPALACLVPDPVFRRASNWGNLGFSGGAPVHVEAPLFGCLQQFRDPLVPRGGAALVLGLRVVVLRKLQAAF